MIGSPKRSDNVVLVSPLCMRVCNSDNLSQSSSVCVWREFRWPFAVHNRARHGDVQKLLTIRGATQHQSAAAHVATANKLRRKSQPVAKIRQQHFNVFPGGYATEKNHFA